MRAGVTVGRVVAAADVPALQADAQVQPRVARAQAVLAAFDGLGQLGDEDLVEVRASRAWQFLSVRLWVNGKRTRKVVRPGSSRA